MKGSKSFAAAVESYLKGADWLTDADLPMVTSLEKTAEALDEKVTGNMLTEYRRLYLLLSKGKSGEDVDEMEDDINS